MIPLWGNYCPVCTLYSHAISYEFFQYNTTSTYGLKFSYSFIRRIFKLIYNYRNNAAAFRHFFREELDQIIDNQYLSCVSHSLTDVDTENNYVIVN